MESIRKINHVGVSKTLYFTPGLLKEFLSFFTSRRSKKNHSFGLALVWHAVMWTIWNSRNEMI